MFKKQNRNLVMAINEQIGGHISDEYQGLDSAVYERDKKKIFWMDGVLDCFSTVAAIFRGPDYKQSKEDDWEVPFHSITDMIYLGCGAQGVVYSGHLNGEIVAVKKLRDKFETNIIHLRKLNHENIVRFRGVCTVAPSYCVIMEYCQYGPLFEFLHSGACFSPKQIMKWAKEIALGMSYLHAHKIIHRDLKSPNVLIADNLVVKVSDFGTSREWNDVSTIMSFTGTVAWMAPEVIRHEPCSEKVDVWSYGVVLWELLTQEVPYKNMETHAIMWGVGTDTITLPIPSTWPGTLQSLLKQCWARVPRQRPSFKILAAHLDMSGDELFAMDIECFNTTQAVWRQEVHLSMEKLYARTEKPVEQDASAQRREDLKQARDARTVYEQQISRANELFMEVCAVRLQLEQREKDVAERENALKGCRCGQRKNLKYYQRQTSSSSDGVVGNAAVLDNRRRKKKPGTAQMIVVNYNENKKNNQVTMTTEEVVTCVCDNNDNNNMDTVKPKKDMVVESNGNVVIKEAPFKDMIDNHVPDHAEV